MNAKLGKSPFSAKSKYASTAIDVFSRGQDAYFNCQQPLLRTQSLRPTYASELLNRLTSAMWGQNISLVYLGMAPRMSTSGSCRRPCHSLIWTTFSELSPRPLNWVLSRKLALFDFQCCSSCPLHLSIARFRMRYEHDRFRLALNTSYCAD